MCLLSTGIFQCICLFGELDTCLLNTIACLIEVAAKTGFTALTNLVDTADWTVTFHKEIFLVGWYNWLQGNVMTHQ